MKKVIGVIPARYDSSRMPFKLVRPLCGMPVIRRTWERAAKARLLDELIIACDDQRIETLAREFGAKVTLTSKEHVSGTDRIAEAVRDLDFDYVINIQADEPLIHPSVIDSLAAEIKNSPGLDMVTIKKEISDPGEINSRNVVKVVTDRNGFALYFSRLPVPYRRDSGQTAVYYKHIGIYAYTKDFLYTFKNLPPSMSEKAEKLEQLRALEAGYRIKVVSTRFDSMGIDTEDDFKRVEELIRGGTNG